MALSIQFGELGGRHALCVATSGASLLSDPQRRGFIVLQPDKWLRLVHWCGKVEPLSEMPTGAKVYGRPVPEGETMALYLDS